MTGIKLLRSARGIPAMVMALAVGVGLTVTVYSLIDAVLLTPLPYARPESLVQVWTATREQSGVRVMLEGEIPRLAEAPSAFRGLASYASVRLNLQRDPASASAPVPIAGALVTANLFDVLGVSASLGRTFNADDSLLSDTPPLVISERLLRTGAVNATIGSLVRLDGTNYRLTGIMPEAFWFPDRQTNFWLPLPPLAAYQAPPTSPSANAPGAAASGAPAAPSPGAPFAAGVTVRSFAVVARLADGVNRSAAEAQANARFSAFRSAGAAEHVQIEPYADMLAAPVRPALLVLQAASGLVLLLVCLNAGWLFAARARRLLPAFATMRALGASPRQVLAAHLVSAACVAAIAIPCAVLIAWMLLRFGMTLESGLFSRTATPAITWHVITVAFLTTVLAGVISCLPGALMVTRRSALGHMHDLSLSRMATPDLKWEGAAMVAQVGLVFAAGAQAVLVALVLLSLSRTNVGLQKTDFLVVKLASRSAASVEPKAQLARYTLLLDRLERRGLRAALANNFPLTDADFLSTFEPRRSRNQIRAMVRTRIVTPSYFSITGLAATSGRLLTPADAGSSSIIVTDAFGPAILQRRDVLGAQTGNAGEFTIVGVVPAMRQYAIVEEAKPEAYVLYDDFLASQPSNASMALQRVVILVEPTAAAGAGAGASDALNIIRQEVASQLPDAEIQSASHVRDLIDLSLGVNRLVAAGSIAFAAVALLLAALGVYAMVTHRLERRRREVGIRITLGATSRRVAIETIRPIAIVYTAGVCLGIALLLFARAAIQAVMVPPPGVGYPPLSLVAGTAAAIVLLVLTVACYRPVKSAAETDPAALLRAE